MEGLSMSYVKDFQTKIENRDYPGYLRIWEEYCASDDLDADEFYAILCKVKISEFGAPIGKYIENILPLWEKMPESEKKHIILKTIIDLETTNTQTLRQFVFDYLTNRYENVPLFLDKIKLIGLKNKDSFQGAISQFELLNHLGNGKFVFHTGGWGVGEIMDVSFLREQMSIEFENVPGRKDMTFSSAFKNLEPIPNDHFLALRFGNPDLLEQKAKENPVEIIRMLLKDLGPKTASEIKDELCEVVIPEEDWSKWWQAARSKVKKDTMIETPEDLRSPFILRLKEVSHEDKLQKLFETSPDAQTFTASVYTFMRDFPETLKNGDFKATLQAKVHEMLSHAELTDAQKISLQFLLEDLSGNKSAEIQQTIQKIASIDALIQALEVQSFKKRALMIVRKTHPNWKEIFINLFFAVDTNALRDYIFGELLSEEADLKKKLEDLFVHPGRYPDIFLWYFQKMMDDSSLPFSDAEGRVRFFEAFFILMNLLEQGSTHKDLLKKMSSLLTGGRYALVRDIFQSSPAKAVQEFLLLATKCHTLSDHDIKILHSLAEVAHPSLAKLNKKGEAAVEDNVIWTTEAGYKKVKDRIEHIATVETVENAREIEVARSHGDLRENAEFKSALEKRSRLQGELKSLSEQVNLARILTKADVATDQVGVGTVVECTSNKGTKITYTLLGPWDADPEKSILSFQSKLAKAITGLKVGDHFQFQGEEFTITAIKSYLV
jgi:transcription elongation factor GreA-like protein